MREIIPGGKLFCRHDYRVEGGAVFVKSVMQTLIDAGAYEIRGLCRRERRGTCITYFKCTKCGAIYRDAVAAS